MLPKAYNLQNFRANTRTADIAVVEGVMGLFDGYDGRTEAGSTAQMAKWLNLPVLLVVNARSMARSAAALVRGFEGFDRELAFAGVLFNAVGSPRHQEFIREALTDHVRMPCLGGVRRDPEIQIPERHLGLITDDEHTLSRERIDALARLAENAMDLDTLVERLPEITWAGESTSAPDRPDPAHQGAVRIGVARDPAFCFYYEDNLELLRQAGAELVFFSPLTDHRLPENLDGLYFGGGYPEVFARQLADNQRLRYGIRENSQKGMPIYGECGGFMYLCSELVDLNNKRYPMTGCFPFTTAMFTRLKALGYREITLTHPTVIGDEGFTIRGHEFHYSELVNRSPDVSTVYAITDRSGMDKTPEGYLTHHTLGSYNHLHFGSQPDTAGCFVENCLAYRNRRI